MSQRNGQRFYTEQWDIPSRSRSKCLECSTTFPSSHQCCPRADCASTNIAPLTHKVSLRSTGEYECSCEAWKFTRHRHEAGWECPHINEARSQREDSEPRRAEPEQPIIERHVERGDVTGFLDTLRKTTDATKSP